MCAIKVLFRLQINEHNGSQSARCFGNCKITSALSKEIAQLYVFLIRLSVVRSVHEVSWFGKIEMSQRKPDADIRDGTTT